MDKKKLFKGILSGIALITAGYVVSKPIVSKKAETNRKKLNIDNPYLKEKISNRKPQNVYTNLVKDKFDSIMAYGGIIALSPVLLVISTAIYINDPGPILFKQKRIGKNKEYFELYKFRSMKMSTPHDVPTHMLENPDQYITRVGKFLRKYSLDEIVQIFNIYEGDMSIIGPRPALWNQDDLILERDKYGANDVKPGLTGWAQINGRDELEIPVKAKIDGDYIKAISKNSLNAFTMDMKCLLGTVLSVLRHDGVVEGGTGEMHKCEYAVDSTEAGFSGYGHLKHFNIDKNRKIKVLITGADSYIGTSFEEWANEHYPNIEIDTVDMIDGTWRDKDFSQYDTVFHVAGLAHADVGKVSEETKQKYYAVNTDLAIETAEKAKSEGVKQFVFMSSMIIYGESAGYGNMKVIGENTVPSPANFYGDSKWQADKGVRALSDENFNVAVIRPPMIYGKGSKGNYPTLAKLAKKLPIFPDVDNQRSMLHIDNLCEFLCLLMLSGENGIYFPQNAEYTNTSDMVKTISHVCEKNIINTKILNPAVAIASHVPGKIGGLVDKAFGNMCYDQKISSYNGLEYSMNDLRESVFKTEGSAASLKKKVLFLVNHEIVIYNFRLEIVEALIGKGYEVHISSPYGEKIKKLQEIGVIWHDVAFDRHGTNPIEELKLLGYYRQLYKEVKPDIVLGFTIKPNIYGAIAAKKADIPFVANVTGLGTAVENGGWKQKMFIYLYKYAFTNVQKIFFQNTENQQFFLNNKIIDSKYDLLPGSGVNLKRYEFAPYPVDSGNLILTTIGRLMKDKGTDEILKAAEIIKNKYPYVTFRFIGMFDGDYKEKIQKAEKQGLIKYLGEQEDVYQFIAESHAILHASYHEGMSNVLLESASAGRPVIATNVSGCIETFDDGVSGISFFPKDVNSMVKAIEDFIILPYCEKSKMGVNGRRKMEAMFDRNIVVNKYLAEIEKI